MPKGAEKARDPYDGLRPWSAITHGFGAVLTIIGAAVLLRRAVKAGFDTVGIVAFTIYALSMIALYTASTLYHSLRTGVKGRMILGKADHLSIYLLIAGTYTPLCVLALDGAWRVSILSVIWGLTAVGWIIKLIWLRLPRGVTASIYIILGWLCVIAIYPLWTSIGAVGIFWLLFGGFFYTFGGILYAVKWPGKNNPRFGCHEIFHVFILLGSIAHYIMMFYILP